MEAGYTPTEPIKQIGHRWYDPSIGRFLSRDPAQSGRNWYGYCGNDPINSADPSGLVKITAHYRQVLGAGAHYWLEIEDNQVGSKTYGKKWLVSGYPGPGHHNSGIPPEKYPLEAELHGTDVSSGKAYDEGSTPAGGVVLVDDQSGVQPWLDQAQMAVNALNAGGYRYAAPSRNCSNTVCYYVMQALGLIGQFDKALGKKKRAGDWLPFAPGIGPPRPRVTGGPKYFPTFHD